VNDIGKPVF